MDTNSAMRCIQEMIKVLEAFKTAEIAYTLARAMATNYGADRNELVRRCQMLLDKKALGDITSELLAARFIGISELPGPYIITSEGQPVTVSFTAPASMGAEAILREIPVSPETMAQLAIEAAKHNAGPVMAPSTETRQ